MAMSRKHYEETAKMIRSERSFLEALSTSDASKLESSAGGLRTLARVTADLACLFANDNARFRMQTFIEACNMGDRVESGIFGAKVIER